MAEEDTEKTEDPTPKKLEEALKRGDVVKSQEVNTWFVIGGATLVLMVFSGSMGSGLNTTMRGFLANSHDIRVDGTALLKLGRMLGGELLSAIAIPFLLLALAALAGNMVQHKLVWSTESLAPKLNKISPLAGLQRLFSKQSLANFIKGLIKLGLIGAVMVVLMWPERDRAESMINTDPSLLVAMTKTLSLKLLGAVVAVLALVAAADYLFQYRTWYQKQKMSLQEIKDEFKNTEGDPIVKGKMKQLRHQRMGKRMMSAVPEAAVVITNPTHYAIALKYERGMDAPICVAKGMDKIALKIREIANEHSVPIVENPPLARALHATVEVDQAIPPDHYKAVAEVIGYVMKLRRAGQRH